MELRPMAEADLPAARAIWRTGIDAGDATFATGLDQTRRLEDALPAARLVAVADGDQLGWAAAWPTSDREVYRGVVDDSLYVAPSAQGRGVGVALLRALIAATEDAGIWTVQASVFPENDASLTVHRRCGFRVVGRRERLGRDRDGRWRDVLLLERRSDAVGRD